MHKPQFKYEKWKKIIESELMDQTSTMKQNKDDFLELN